jgi:cyclin-dependent kinase 7
MYLKQFKEYTKDKKIGEGTYAVVFVGKAVPFEGEPQVVAIKSIKAGLFKDGLDLGAIREIKYLKELHHPNIINV